MTTITANPAPPPPETFPATTAATAATKRGQWLRAAILGASDGILSTTSIMLGVGAARENRMSVLISGVASAVAGAFSMAVGEFVSVATQRDVELAAASRLRDNKHITAPAREVPALPSPMRAAAASGAAFMAGAAVPLLAGAFVEGNVTRIIVLAAVTTAALAVCGGISARLGGAPARASAARVVVGGWVAMGVTYSMLKPLDDDKD